MSLSQLRRDGREMGFGYIAIAIVSAFVAFAVGVLVGARLKSNYETLNQMMYAAKRFPGIGEPERAILAKSVWQMGNRETLVADWEMRRLWKLHFES